MPAKPTLSITIYQDRDQETEINYQDIATPEQKAKLIKALEDNLEILRKLP
jgi:hypothetical protein